VKAQPRGPPRRCARAISGEHLRRPPGADPTALGDASPHAAAMIRLSNVAIHAAVLGTMAWLYLQSVSGLFLR